MPENIILAKQTLHASLIAPNFLALNQALGLLSDLNTCNMAFTTILLLFSGKFDNLFF